MLKNLSFQSSSVVFVMQIQVFPVDNLSYIAFLILRHLSHCFPVPFVTIKFAYEHNKNPDDASMHILK